ncbi:MAG: hypothetical protein JW818_01990 [Pirellulales bacterium]|nr:hypothetical protein [Pirellulales bacterium]
MTSPLVKPGQTVNVQLLSTVPRAWQKFVLIKTANVELLHLVIPKGETVPTHEAQGEVVLHCLEGQIAVSARGCTDVLSAGQLSYFLVNEPFAIHGIELASMVVTIIAPQQGPPVELIGD